LTFTVMGQILQHPLRHVGLLAAISALIVVSGWGLGTAIRWLVPGNGALHFVVECGLWVMAAGLVASPLAIKRFRDALIAVIPS